MVYIGGCFFMKRILSLLLCSIFLVACSSSSNSNVLSAPSSAPTQSNSHTDSEAPLESSEGGMLRFSSGLSLHGNKSGTYFVQMNEQGEYQIYFADYPSKQIVALCSKPNCAHDGEECTSWVQCRANKPYIIPLEDKLVYLYPGNPAYFDIYGEATLPFIEVRSLTGEFLKKVIEFGSGIKLSGEYAVDKDAIYLLEENVSTSDLNITRSLIKVSLSDGKKSVIVSFEPEAGENYFWVGTNDNQFIFKKIKADPALLQVGGQKMISSQTHELFTVDKSGNISASFQKWQQDTGAQFGVDNALFFIENRTLSSIVPDTQITVEHGALEPSYVSFSAYVEPFVILNSSVYRSASFDAPIYYAANMETGEFKELSLIADLGQDSQFIFWSNSGSELFGMYFDDSGQQQFASISIDDLWSNVPNWVLFEKNF